jgi:hypothetical protein
MRFTKKLVVLSLILMLILSGCYFSNSPNIVEAVPNEVLVTLDEAPSSGAFSVTNEPLLIETSISEEVQNELPVELSTEQPTEESLASAASTATVLPDPTQIPSYSVGPTNFPEGVNPLTGLLVADPDMLRYPPALISVSNFPASARPQAGLSTSPLVFEMAIGEGMTRFLAVFYGSFPSAVSGQTEGDVNSGSTSGGGSTSGSDSTADGQIGPIRSGRLPYETMRAQLNGFLVIASASSNVAATLNSSTNFFGSDSSDINSAMIGVDQLEKIANAQYTRIGKEPYLEGLYFDMQVPANGSIAEKAWIYYSFLNQVQWQYDPELGAYKRSDISTDGKSTFTLSTDRLNSQPIAKENVIILFANHDYKKPTLINIELDNIVKGKAILFRDGQAYNIFWTSKYGDFEKETGLLRPIRFMDAEGNPFPLKPGETWIEIVSLSSSAWESDPTRFPFIAPVKQPGSGLWAIRYYGKY